MYGEIGSKSNTMIFSERPADINALLAQVSAVMSATPKTRAKATKPKDAEEVVVKSSTKSKALQYSCDILIIDCLLSLSTKCQANLLINCKKRLF